MLLPPDIENKFTEWGHEALRFGTITFSEGPGLPRLKTGQRTPHTAVLFRYGLKTTDPDKAICLYVFGPVIPHHRTSFRITGVPVDTLNELKKWYDDTPPQFPDWYISGWGEETNPIYAPWGPYFLLAPWLCRQSISYGEERRDREGKLTGYRSRPACFRSEEVA